MKYAILLFLALLCGCKEKSKQRLYISAIKATVPASIVTWTNSDIWFSVQEIIVKSEEWPERTDIAIRLEGDIDVSGNDVTGIQIISSNGYHYLKIPMIRVESTNGTGVWVE